MKKKVIWDQPSKEVYVEDINDYSFVGIQFESGRKTTPAQLTDRIWICVEVGEEVDREVFTRVRASSIQELVRVVVDCKGVYVFDTRNELLEWLKD